MVFVLCLMPSALVTTDYGPLTTDRTVDRFNTPVILLLGLKAISMY